MSRVSLAFRCFFRLLAGRGLPVEAAAYLPEEAAPPAQLPAASPRPAAGQPAARPAEPTPAEPRPEPRIERRPAAPSADLTAHHRDGALALLALLQREGRLVDFLREPLDTFTDADIGAAVRDIHRGCKKVLEEHFVIEAVMPGEEDARVKVPAGFDAGEVRLIGKVAGEPPFTGTLRHHGWRVTQVTLPTLTEGVDRRVVAPAEVEIAPAAGAS
jgi:hypothetical protein